MLRIIYKNILHIAPSKEETTCNIDNLRKENKQQAEEIARLKSDLTGTAFALSDHSAENIQLRKDIDQMEERLFKYGRCLPDCTGKYTGGNCNCGWETVLKESEAK